METEKLRVRMLSELEDASESKQKITLMEKELLGNQERCNELIRDNNVAQQKLRLQAEVVRTHKHQQLH
jgi:hypothetical protein